MVTRTYAISNRGTAILNLDGSPRVALSGTHFGNYSVTQQPSSSIAAGGSSTFKIQFNPNAIGNRNAMVTIANNDSNENPYNFSIRGTGEANSVPEIGIKGNGHTITDGDSSPSTSDHTHFGTISSSSGSVTRTYTIQNTGNASLGLTGDSLISVTGSNFSAFTVSQQPSSSIPAGGSTNFEVKFNSFSKWN